MEENKLNKSNKLKIIVLTALIFLVAISGITYAYFTIQVTGNETASSMRLTTANLSLVYTDVQIVSGENVTPGWTQTKTLTVYNDGNQTAYYNIIWRELLNEITNNELVISATCSSSSGSCNDISETVIPTKTTEAHNISVKNNIEIPVGVTHTYTVTVTFKETGSNQNYNQNKEFYGTLNIAEGSEPVAITRMGTDATTGLPVVKIDNEEFYDITNAINYTNLINTNGNIYNYAANKSILLAKYNLYVGHTGSNDGGVISSSTSGYGLQNSSTGGTLSYNVDKKVNIVPMSKIAGAGASGDDDPGSLESYTIGSVAFSNSFYWSSYTDAQKKNIYNESLSSTSDWTNSGYSIAYYVEEYVNTLGIDGIGRLLTYTEAYAMTQTQMTNGASYWLGSAYSSNRVWYVYSTGGMAYIGNGEDNERGVRPVIVVNTSDIQSS